MTEKSSNRFKGKLGEDIGEIYLKNHGYKILERNVQSPFGEIDMIALHQGTLVFVEVKSRRDNSFGYPEEAITRQKKTRLTKLATWHMKRYTKTPQARFDVLAIQAEGAESGIRLIQNAFEI